MNRAIVQKKSHGGDPIDGLEIVEKPIPEALAGRVVVHILLRPINPTDLVTIRSQRLIRFSSTPSTPGSEGFGIVHSVGDGVTKVKPGQRVVPFMWEGLLKEEGVGGSWQEYVSIRESMLAAVPDSIPDEIAAQFIINPWTVYGMLKDLAVPKGEYILQTAAGSVLGRQVIQLAKYWGIKTINVVRRPEQVDELKAIGADEVICSTTEDVVAKVKGITNKKLAYGSLDCVGGELTKSVLASTRRGGQVLIYGVLSGNEATIAINDLFRQVSVSGWFLPNYWNIEEKREEFICEVMKLLELKVIEPFLGPTYDFAHFKQAIVKSEEVSRGGKVLLRS